MSLVLGLWLLFGFFANLPTASSIQCFQCGDYPGSTVPCKGSSAMQCESNFDSCVTIKTEVEFYGVDSSQTVKNCSIAESPSCDQTYICDLANKSVTQAGGNLLECDVTCCQTDGCNGPDEGEPKLPTPGSYPQRNFSELKYFIKTVRALLDELEYIVDKELEGQLSAEEYKERVKEIFNEFYAAIPNEEEQKSNSVMDGMKTSAAELMKKLETMRGQSKKNHAAVYQFLNEAMENLLRLAAQER